MSLIGAITLAVGLVGAAAVLWLRAAPAAALFMAMLVLWPDEVALTPLGTIALDPVKLMGPCLLLNLLFKERRLRGMRVNWLDVSVGLLVAGRLISGLVNIPLMELVEDQGNGFLRSILAYVAFRLAVRDRAELFVVLRTLVYTCGFLAVVCIYETFTGISLYDLAIVTIGGYEWRTPWPPRLGLYRAVGSYNNPLPTGLLFVFAAPVSLILRFDPKWSFLKTAVFTPLLGAGILATMSTGPILAAAVSASVIALYPLRKLAPVAFGAALTIAGFWIFVGPQLGAKTIGETLSIGAYNPGNADYRIGLIEEALTGGMTGHWLFGYGRVGLGIEEPDSPDFTWQHQDLVNMWVLTLAYYGLLGFVPLLLMNVWAVVHVGASIYGYPSRTTDLPVWLFLSGFVGWQVAFITVAPLASLYTIYYAVIGITSNLPGIVARWQDEVPETAPGIRRETRRFVAPAPAQAAGH